MRGCPPGGACDPRVKPEMAPKRRRNDPQACEVRYAGGGTWQRFASQTQAEHAFPDLPSGQLSNLLNCPARCPPAVRARFEARRVPAGNEPVAVGAVVEAAPQAFGPEHTVRYRGTVIAPGTGLDLPSGCPAPLPDEPVWRVRYNDDGKVWATPERFLSAVAPPPPPAPAPAPPSRDPAWYVRAQHVSERHKTVRTVARLLQSRKPNNAEWLRRVPQLAVRLEEELLRSARSFDEYGDERTLKPRLQALAAAMGRRAQQERREADAFAEVTATGHPLAALGAAMVGAVITATSFEERTGSAAAPARPFAAYAFFERLRASRRLEDFKRILAGAGTDLAAMRRRVTRLLCDDLDTLEDFHHLTRREPPSLSREGAPIAWVNPARGAELAAYSDCAAAAREWGLPESAVADCVYGRTPTANGLSFDYRGLPPPRSSGVRDGVYRLPNGRFRVQLGDDWGFFGNYASEGAAALVADRVTWRGLAVPPAIRSGARGFGAGPGKACEVRLSGGAWQRFASQSLAVRAFPGLAENTLSALLNHPSECPATVRARFEARRVVAENVYVS